MPEYHASLHPENRKWNGPEWAPIDYAAVGFDLDELALLRGWLWSVVYRATMHTGVNEFSREMTQLHDEVRTQFIEQAIPPLAEFLAVEDQNGPKNGVSDP